MGRARTHDEHRRTRTAGATGWALLAVAALAVAFGASRFTGGGAGTEPPAIAGRLASANGNGGGGGSGGSGNAAQDPPLSWSAPRPLAATLQGTSGVSRALGAGRGCDGTTAVTDTHLLLEHELAAGTLSPLTGTARANLGISGPVDPTNPAGPAPSEVPTHRLEPASSHVTFADERGTLRFQLDGAGACPGDNLAVDLERRLTGTGALTLVAGTGAYRDAELTDGAWDLATTAGPGADNHWRLLVDGDLAVLRPGLELAVARVEWANVGDFLNRIVTVDLTVRNPGPGDAYGASLTGLNAPAGVHRLSPLPVPLGDLLAGDETVVRMRYQLPLLGQPCFAVILACQFGTTATASLPDALGQPVTATAAATVTAPALPIQL